jgi:nitroimidazol reductase NimA-like FMN-containing flavoprotein (pyridoxamine 5'-phosphate oxidase superfamily)
MRKVYEVKDKDLIEDIVSNAEYGTLALCSDNKPYSIPLNFVQINEEIFFHGSKKGKKIDIMKDNSNASFSLVESHSLLPSYFSTDTGNASPATHMFKSVIIDGTIEFVEDYEQKANALECLMKKYQKEGGYKPLNDEIYKKIINATFLYKLIAKETSAKFHLGQDYNEERFTRVCEHLKQRGTKKDLKTLELLIEYRKK